MGDRVSGHLLFPHVFCEPAQSVYSFLWDIDTDYHKIRAFKQNLTVPGASIQDDDARQEERCLRTQLPHQSSEVQ